MVVEKGNKVNIEYALFLENNATVSANVKKYTQTYVQGNGEIIPGLEEEIEGMEIGETKMVEVKPEKGFGQVNHEAFLEVDKSQLAPDQQAIGAIVEAKSPHGDRVRGRLVELKEHSAIVDFNHPLAGRTFFVDVTVKDVQ